MTAYTKAIMAGLGAVVVLLETFAGVNVGLDEGQLSAIAAVVATALVYFLPNKA